MIKIKNATKNGYILICDGGVLDISRPDSETRRGRAIEEGRISPTLDTGCHVGVIQIAQLYGTKVEPNPQAGRVFSKDGISPCLDSMRGGNSQPKILEGTMVEADGRKIRIRRLTPKECFRLQGFSDDLEEKAAFVNSDSQLYKQIGNSVTVNVIYEIAKRLE